MANTEQPAAHVLHRLLFRALVEMRVRGHEQQDKLVFHLADLFHNVVLEMECAADGRKSYEDVLALLNERAAEKGLGRWLETATAELAEDAPAARG